MQTRIYECVYEQRALCDTPTGNPIGSDGLEHLVSFLIHPDRSIECLFLNGPGCLTESCHFPLLCPKKVVASFLHFLLPFAGDRRNPTIPTDRPATSLLGFLLCIADSLAPVQLRVPIHSPATFSSWFEMFAFAPATDPNHVLSCTGNEIRNADAKILFESLKRSSHLRSLFLDGMESSSWCT